MLCTFREQRPWRQSIELLRLQAEGRRLDFPDLEQEVRVLVAFASPLLTDLQRFGDLVGRRGDSLLVDLCHIDDGSGVFVLGVHLQDVRASVRPADEFLGGVVFSGSVVTGACRVAPRVLRLVCRNGAVLPVCRELETDTYVRTSPEEVHGDMEEVIGEALSLRTVATVTGALRGAAMAGVLDPVQELARHGVEVPGMHTGPFVDLFKKGRDRSLYGAFNALTATARDQADLREREKLERLAGKLIPVLRRADVLAGLPVLA